MSERFLLYYITDRNAFGGDERQRRLRLLKKIAEATRVGVEYIQLREKDLSGRDLEGLAREALRAIAENSKSENGSTLLLINSRTDVALAIGAAGVHLRGDDISVADARAAWGLASDGFDRTKYPIISVACHSAEKVNFAAADGASLAIFAPVFEKRGALGIHAAGIEELRKACRAKIPVLALGGVNLENAKLCVEAGAGGIAGIRLFQENDMGEVVKKLRSE
ncbi:MAG: thiamine phosphate synthase [Candidatus Sulfotelmatobacter sp.]